MPRAAFPSGRKSLLLFVLVAVVIGGAWWWQWPPPEPVYQGQRFAEFLAGWTPPDNKPYPERLVEFGPEGVTWLAYTLEHGYQSEPLLFDHTPFWLRRWLPLCWGGARDRLRLITRVEAAEALGDLGPLAAPAIPALARVLEGTDEDLARQAAITLNAIGPASWSVVQQTLGRGNSQARYAILCEIHMRAGTSERPAPDAEIARLAATLVKACRDPVLEVRTAAVIALGRSRFLRQDTNLLDSAIPDLLHLLSDSDPDLRRAAVVALEQFGSQGSSAVPRLIELLDEGDSRDRRDVAQCLSVLDRDGKLSVSRLRLMLNDSDADCRIAAAEALNARSQYSVGEGERH